MMEESLCPPVTVEGDWTPDQTKTIKNKLRVYFGSKKKSNGGDCRVELEDGAPTAAVYFRSEEVRQRVLAKENHEIILGNQTVKLRLVSASSPMNSDNVSESVQSVAVVLDNVSDKTPRGLLLLLVENISGLDESSFSLEIIWETNQAVVTFNHAADVEKFLTVSQNSQKLEIHGLTARPLEAAKSVRVESLPPTVVKDLLELYFEKNWSLPDHIIMIPDEQAAIVTFSHPKVVESICKKEDYVMRSIPVKVYPYYKSLGTALYGKQRPTWKMPEPFTESVHHAVWKFLQMKKQSDNINEHMRPYFCCVDLDNPEVKLSPLPSFLRQKDLTAEHVDNWMSTAQKAFRQHMAQYMAFECPVNTPAWEAAEEEVRSVVREDAVLMLDASRGILTLAGQADIIKQIRVPVENIIFKAMNQIDQLTNVVSEVMNLSGLQNPVKEVSRSLKDLVANNSKIQETIRVESCAVVQFLDKKKSQDCSNIAKDNDVTVHFDSERPQIIIAGARLYVQKAKSCFKELINALFTDNFMVDKPGAKKYFQSQGSLFLSTLMTDFSCMVVLHSENQEEEEEENYETVIVPATAVDKECTDLEPTMTIPQQAGRGSRMSLRGLWRREETTARGLKGNIQDPIRFTRQVRDQTRLRNRSPDWQSLHKLQQSSASFGQVSSPSFDVYQMQMGQLTLEVSSGDITKEASDVIINSSNQKFTLKSGVSKAILDSAGVEVELECLQIVKTPGYQPGPMILTSAGLLPSKKIIHVVGQNDPAEIKEIVYSVLKVCERNKFSSVSFPALGTGQGGANPSAVADAMVDAVLEFVRKMHPRFVRSVKILIFQTAMVMEFHKSMKKRQGEDVEEKSVFTKLKGSSEERPNTDHLVLKREEFEPAVFQLCAYNAKAVSQAKKRIEELILAEQAKRTISDPYISKLTQADMEELKALQRKLTVSIHLDRSPGNQEPTIHLEGLTSDVLKAESSVRDIIRKVERTENERQKASLVSGLVEWQFQHRGKMVPFDMYTNLNLEKALEKKQKTVTIKINNQTYTAHVMFKKAVSVNGSEELDLLRKDLKADDAALPSHWDDMKGNLVKLFPVTVGSKEYSDVEKEIQKTGLFANIISIERVQNATLWQSYQLKKKQLEAKNNHKNNEKMLFHGTGPDSTDLINKQGFNRSYAGAHGARFGNGTYFAVDPVYSAKGYAKPNLLLQRRMYLARVLVGDFAQGRAGMITPPARSFGNTSDLYDSVTDNPARPTMFVIFNDIQAYPEYLITFT